MDKVQKHNSCDTNTPSSESYRNDSSTVSLQILNCVSDKGKGKSKVALCLNKHHVTKTYWGNGSSAPHIVTLSTGWRFRY